MRSYFKLQIILFFTIFFLLSIGFFPNNKTYPKSSGNGGIVINKNGSLNSLCIQSDGKIVAGGYSISGDIGGWNQVYNFKLVRYNTKGTLDSTFGTNGTVINSVENKSCEINCIALQTDGRIVAAGKQYTNPDVYFAIARYKTDGTLDSTFGKNGIATGNDSANSGAYRMAIQNNGKIIAVGGNLSNHATIIQYNQNGTLDSTFGTKGIVTPTFGTLSLFITSIKVQNDSKIIIAGGVADQDEYSTSVLYNFFAARYDTNGVLDSTFGNSGFVVTPVGVTCYASSAFILNDGKILLVGGNNNVILVRYNSDGKLDNTFGTLGIVNNSNVKLEVNLSAAVQDDEKILVAGSSEDGTGYDFRIARFNSNGTLDGSFGMEGIVTTPVELLNAYVNSVVVQNDQKIIVAGGTYDCAIVRYNSNGSLDNTFGKYPDIISLNAIVPFQSTSPPFLRDITSSYAFNRLLLEIKIKDLRTEKIPLHNIKLKAYYNNKPMQILLNTFNYSLDSNKDSFIDIFPPPDKDSIQFIAVSDTFSNNQINKLIEIIISRIDSNYTNIFYQDTISYYFAKNPRNGRSFSLSRDAYSFPNPSRLTISECSGFLKKYSLNPFSSLLVNSMLLSISQFEDGRSYGMAATAGSYFLFPSERPYTSDEVYNYNPQQGAVMTKINAAYLSQLYYNKYNNFDSDASYYNLLNQIENNNPVLMDFGSHSDLALALTTFKGEKKSYISLYENNFPDSNYTAIFNLNDNTFYYSYGDSAGFRSYTGFSTVPSSVFSGINLDTVINHFMTDLSKKLMQSAEKLFTISGSANLMLENHSAQRAGYDSLGIFHNEIINSTIYKLPAGDSLSDSLTGIYAVSNQNYVEKIYGSGDGYINVINYSILDSGNIAISYVDSIYITASTICTLSEDDKLQALKIDWNGDGIVDSTVHLIYNILTSVEENQNNCITTPIVFDLSQNYPNPFNPSTMINYEIPKTGLVTIKIYDVLGRQVETLVNEEKSPGRYKVKFDGSKLASGLYFYRITSNNFTDTKKMLLMK